MAPAVPILFFGDLEAYCASPLRVVTVGLNPSRHEFPVDEPFRRFPLAEFNPGRDPTRYLDAMSDYFRTDPYRRWFRSFGPLLNGLGTSYYDGSASTALHTDICSPVATNPTWSQLTKLDKTNRTVLEEDGGPLWHQLLSELKPHVVVLSVARSKLARIEFRLIEEWRVVHSFRRKADGTLRSAPYEISAGWHNVGGTRSLFCFGAAAQLPLGTLAAEQKQEAGKLLLEAFQDG